MTFFNSIKTCYMKSFDFKGRASKSEYWWFWLFQMVLGVLTYYTLESDGHEILKGVLIGCVIASMPASLSVIARRLHDVGFSLRGCLMKILITTGILIVWSIFYPVPEATLLVLLLVLLRLPHLLPILCFSSC